jgi:hypothetical protein
VLADPVYHSFNLMFSLDQVCLSSYMLVVCFDTLLATSVDGEWDFSVGCTAIKHNQHALLVNTFQAKVALGQWVDQPFMPSINVLAEAIHPKHPKLEEPLNAVRDHPWLQSRLTSECNTFLDKMYSLLHVYDMC